MSHCPAVVLIAVLMCPSPARGQAGSQPPAAVPSSRPSLRATRAPSGGAHTIRLDGLLDEPAWSAADSIASLTEIEPREGRTPAGRTIVRVLVDERALVFGIRAENPPGVGLVAFARNRDAGLDSEDHIKIVLDTYLDGRSGYVFAVNPNGARYDALVANQGEGEDSNWDAVWEAASA